MTKAEWLEARDSWPMLRFLESQTPSRRKFRLFVCACCRHFNWDTMRSVGIDGAVVISERFADGLATEGELSAASERFGLKAWSGSSEEVIQALWAARLATDLAGAHWSGKQPISAAMWAAIRMRGPRLWKQLLPSARRRVSSQCDLLRDLFCPFAAVAVQPSWLAWNDKAVPRVAQVAYDERILPGGHLDPSRLAVLADALEDAGCDDRELLGHLRGPGVHVRGCWAVDALIGKT